MGAAIEEERLIDLVGRDAELERLHAFVAGSGAGPSVLTIEGEPGAGKTALFDAAVTRAAQEGLRVSALRCTAAESGLGYTGLADLLSPRAVDVLPGMATPLRRVLEVVLLRREVGEQAVEPQAVGRAVLEALRSLAGERPVLVAIDDSQWLDPDSARALTFAVRRLAGVPVRVLVSRRSGDGSAPQGLDVAGPEVPATRLPVGPLEPRAVEALLERRFAEPLPRSIRSRILAIAAGNPLYAVELAAAVRRDDPTDAAGLVLPPRLADLLADRLGRFAENARQPLAAVASLAAPTVAQVVDALGPDARAGLDPVLDAGVLHVAEGRLWFDHPLLGLAALDRLTPSERRWLHARLATVVTEPQARAWHLIGTADGPDEDTAAAAERGADAARARGAPEVAAALAEAAARLTPASRIPDRCRRLVAAGYHRVMSGEIGRGRAHLAAAVDATPRGPGRADLMWRLGMLTHLDGNLAEAVRLVEAARAEAGDNAAVAAEATRRLAGLYGWQGRTAQAVDCWRSALEWARASGDTRAELETLSSYGMAALLTGAIDPVQTRDRIDRLAAAAGPFAVVEDPDGYVAMVSLMLGDLADATCRLERLRRRAIDAGDELGQAGAAVLLLQVDLITGRWDRAARLADEVVRFVRGCSALPAFGFDRYAVALVEAHRGNVGPARMAATEMLDLAKARGTAPMLLQARSVLGFAELVGGDPRAAHAHCGAVLDSLRADGIRESGWVHLAWYDVDALVALGELDRAEELVAELATHGRAGRPLARAVAARGRGLVLAARGDTTGARAALDDALAEHADLDWPLERGRALLTLGTVLRRGRHKRTARERLQQARDIFDRLGARSWSAAATGELARIGGRAPRTAVSTPAALTPAERRVAQAVAAGHTNQEIADRLFLSVKTVAAHLTRVYAKLDVRTRTELAIRLRDAPD
ncbi:helix-turn-helix transcriptional regulator [Virgisporangium aurantiacum]|uniref:Transcriptional regulator n=1 Tax=Virgisporangium aurantiacum TaxID=175570 RepID=A0A8J4E847_9ACTN|nr:LuxR family transcriptional regulator [Virgisporangium aurantiacum]GIJ64873.1 transcriptional regulator [Virgisporangium aurantiacum]